MCRQAGWVGAFAVLIGLCGCSSARYVSVNPDGGVVAIPRNSNSWPEHNRDRAEELMREKCPNGYVIEREEEVVVGTTQSTRTDRQRTGDPLLAALKIAPVNETTEAITSSVDRTEWRIWFHATPTSEKAHGGEQTSANR